MSRQRRAFVTGATGYLGANLCRHLVSKGWDVHALVRPGSNRRPLAGRTVSLHQMQSGPGDVAAFIAATAPDVIFNLAAAMPGGTADQSGDKERLEAANVALPRMLCDVLKTAGGTSLVHAASWWEWDDRGNPHTRQTAPNRYARTKAEGRRLIETAAESGDFSCAVLVVHDTYGPNDWRGKVLNALVKAALSGQHLDMTPGDQMLDLVHVDDVVEAFEMTAKSLMDRTEKVSERYALSSGCPMSLRALAGAVEEATGNRLDITWGAVPHRPGTPMKTGSMAPTPPGWQPQVTLAGGLAGLIAEERQPDGAG